MRGFIIGLVLTMAVLLPKVGNAQVYQFGTPPPDVSAAGALWLVNGEPIVVGGLTYYPTRGFRLFDPQIMVQTGMFERVPIYSDATLLPYAEAYVPVGSGRMRVYERRPDLELAGTTGSYLQYPVETASRAASERLAGPARAVGVDCNCAAPTAGAMLPMAVASAALPSYDARSRRTEILTPFPHLKGVSGVWVDFDGARWFITGRAVSFSADRFEPIGEYHGFPVFRDKTSSGDGIYVAAVKDGPLVPYAKR